ncbi:hypothetical protein [Nitrospirillum iridis]|uniref:Uncharacterized protein n=1 Tax=Nitrospirillum iridis TaxID=765888 RepID=A0A7X0ECB2_9PROT|nr:hypothetical protein [Nitrospirillum iridis]MBB6249826.1 hypothetical protein [Nitrospirillum iridis]
MTTVTATRTTTPNLLARVTALVETAGMLGVAAVVALCINAML